MYSFFPSERDVSVSVNEEKGNNSRDYRSPSTNPVDRQQQKK
jgi:hypothetical protein